MDKIRINNLKFFTKNGVLAEEKRLGQQVEIDLEMPVSYTHLNAAEAYEVYLAMILYRLVTNE